MKPILTVAAILVMCGCGQPTFDGSIKVTRYDGKIRSIEVTLPTHGNKTVRNRTDADLLISQLEGLASDLKAARDQMPEEERPSGLIGKGK